MTLSSLIATPKISRLPPALKGQFTSEPKWVDLRAYRGNADQRDAKLMDLGADFAAAIHGTAKEDLLSQEVRQQRRVLNLASSAVVFLLVSSGFAAWQWKVALESERAAIEQKQIAQEQGEIAVARRNQALIAESMTRAEQANRALQTGDAAAAIL